MPLPEIAGRRPASSPTEYGRNETLSGIEVRYFGDRGESSEPVDSNSDVRAIEATWVVSDSGPNADWSRLIAQIDAVTGSTARCVDKATTVVTARVAVWPLHIHGLALLRHTAVDSVQRAGEWRHAPPSMTLIIVLDSATAKPLLTDTMSVDCMEAPARPSL